MILESFFDAISNGTTLVTYGADVYCWVSSFLTKVINKNTFGKIIRSLLFFSTEDSQDRDLM